MNLNSFLAYTRVNNFLFSSSDTLITPLFIVNCCRNEKKKKKNFTINPHISLEKVQVKFYIIDLMIYLIIIETVLNIQNFFNLPFQWGLE